MNTNHNTVDAVATDTTNTTAASPQPTVEAPVVQATSNKMGFWRHAMCATVGVGLVSGGILLGRHLFPKTVTVVAETAAALLS